MLLDQRFIHHLLGDPDVPEYVKAVLRWQFRLYGDFFTNLFKAIMHADQGNLARLRAGFPAEVDGYVSYTQGDLANRLKDQERAFLAGLDQ